MSNGTKTGSMREVMPFTTSVIDELRLHFGADQIDPSIRDGMAGLPRFFASENGREVGTRTDVGPNAYVLDEAALAVHVAEARARKPAGGRG